MQQVLSCGLLINLEAPRDGSSYRDTFSTTERCSCCCSLGFSRFRQQQQQFLLGQKALADSVLRSGFKSQRCLISGKTKASTTQKLEAASKSHPELPRSELGIELALQASFGALQERKVSANDGDKTNLLLQWLETPTKL